MRNYPLLFTTLLALSGLTVPAKARPFCAGIVAQRATQFYVNLRANPQYRRWTDDEHREQAERQAWFTICQERFTAAQNFRRGLDSLESFMTPHTMGREIIHLLIREFGEENLSGAIAFFPDDGHGRPIVSREGLRVARDLWAKNVLVYRFEIKFLDELVDLEEVARPKPGLGQTNAVARWLGIPQAERPEMGPAAFLAELLRMPGSEIAVMRLRGHRDFPPFRTRVHALLNRDTPEIHEGVQENLHFHLSLLESFGIPPSDAADTWVTAVETAYPLFH